MTPRKKGASRTPKRTLLLNRAFNKLLLQADENALTDEERRAAEADLTLDAEKNLDVPVELMTPIAECRKAYPSLKERCRIVSVNNPRGKWISVDVQQNFFTPLDEIVQSGTPNLSSIEYEITDYGLVLSLPNQLLVDTDVNIVELLAADIARAEISVENARIVEQLQALTPSTLNSYRDLMRALLVDLPPRYFPTAMILTNRDGALWLNSLSDEKKRPLLMPTATQTDALKIWGKDVVILSEEVLPTEEGKAPMYIGALDEFCLFFERLPIQASLSSNFLFDRFLTAIHFICRFGVSTDRLDAVGRYEITLA